MKNLLRTIAICSREYLSVQILRNGCFSCKTCWFQFCLYLCHL